MIKEELETLYMDIYDNGLVSNEYKEKFKRYINNCIAESEKKLAISEHDREHNDYELAEVYKKVEQLKEKISVLLSCKNCPDNKGGYICQKEYEDKCLSQKIQYIKELKEENTELKNQIEKMKCCANCKYQCQFLYQIGDCLKNGLFKWEMLEESLND